MSPNPPLVSIVIPVYNKEKTLARTLACIHAQSMADYEVILVDDGSTDRSLEIAEGASLPLRILRQENSGPSKARNRGLRESAGTYVAFLDADDLWEPDFLAEAVAAFRRNPEVQAVASAYRVLRSDGVRVHPPEGHALRAGPVSGFFRVYSESRFCWTGGTVIECDLLRRIGGFREDLWIGEDVELWCRIGALAMWSFIPKPLASYRDTDSNSLTRSSMRASRSADLWVWEKDLLPILSPEQLVGYRRLRWRMLKTQMMILLRAREFERFRAHARAYRGEVHGRQAWLLRCAMCLPGPVLRPLALAYVRVLKGWRAVRSASARRHLKNG